MDITEVGLSPAETNANKQRSDEQGGSEAVATSQSLNENEIPNVNAHAGISPIPEEHDIRAFSSQIAQYRQKLDQDYRAFEDSLSQKPDDEELQGMDWNDLQQRYNDEMESKIAEERDIADQISNRFKQFLLWMQVSNDREAERALKRLRTRIAFVQNSEEELSAKQEHYAKVVGAFQQAMAMLGNL